MDSDSEHPKIEDLRPQFEALGELESEFDSVELEILRIRNQKEAPLYARRNQITSQITGFWPHVLEESASNIGLEEHVTPEDMVVLGSLSEFNVLRPDDVEPRTFEIVWTFQENEYMPAQTITKKFTHQEENDGRRTGLTGLVSEPVEIKWKDGKDLTEGINRAATEAFEERKAKAGADKDKKGKSVAGLGPKEEKLLNLIPNVASFFCWFSYTGSHNELGENGNADGDEDEEERSKGTPGPVEAFSCGDELATQLADDMYPAAVKYFLNSYEECEEESDGEGSDIDLDSELEEQNMKNAASSSGRLKSKRNGADEDGPAKKKLKG